MRNNGRVQRPKSCGRVIRRIDNEVCRGLVIATSVKEDKEEEDKVDNAGS